MEMLKKGPKSEGDVYYRIVTRWFKKSWSVCKNLEDQTKLGRLETVDSEALLQVL